MPLVVLTAFEGLLEQLEVPKGTSNPKSLLVVNGAGGVGSVVVQIAKKLCGLTVIATASRPDTIEYVKKLGADFVINHREPLLKQIQELKLPRGLVDYVFNAHTTEDYFEKIPEILSPRGKVVFITGTPSPLNAGLYMAKRQTVTWEFMFSRSVHQYELDVQGAILDEYAKLVDEGVLVHTVEKVYKIEEIRDAYNLLDSGRSIGKIALTWE
jgi:NADPH2:quinone reductase